MYIKMSNSEVGGRINVFLINMYLDIPTVSLQEIAIKDIF